MTLGRGCRSNKCYNCGKFGHFAKDCWFNKRIEEKENIAEIGEHQDGVLLMANKEMIQENDVIWYLDSGASNHMSELKHLLTDLREINSGFVSFGDASKVEVKGKGEISFSRKEGRQGKIEDVYFVPDLKNNILSLGQLLEKGYSIFMEKKIMFLKDKNGSTIAQIEMSQNRMFKLNLRNIQETCIQVKIHDKATLWHRRVGHLHYGGVKEMSNKGIVHGIPSMDFSGNFCEDCVLGKQIRNSFQKKAIYHATKRLELVHMDICCPITPKSYSSKRYFLTFIDDYSRRTWVYFLYEKSEALKVFKKFKVLVEKKMGMHIKGLRSDRGGEYTSNDFTEYFEQHGIRRFLTALYSPQQNGVVERKNRTILDMVRSMLKSKELPKELWAKTVQCAFYTQNGQIWEIKHLRSCGVERNLLYHI